MAGIQHQLHEAWKGSGLTLQELRDKAKLNGLSIVSLSRKLRGLQVLRTDECSAIAKVLGLSFTIGSRRGSA